MNNLQFPPLPIRLLTKPTTKNNPKLDKTTQGIKNKNLSKTKYFAANNIETQPTKTQATRKFDTSDFKRTKTKNPTTDKNIKS